MILSGTLRLVFESVAQGGHPFPSIGPKLWTEEEKHLNRRWREIRAVSSSYQETIRRWSCDPLVRRIIKGQWFARQVQRLLSPPPLFFGIDPGMSGNYAS